MSFPPPSLEFDICYQVAVALLPAAQGRATRIFDLKFIVFLANERSLLASRSHRIRAVRSVIFGTHNVDVFLAYS